MDTTVGLFAPDTGVCNGGGNDGSDCTFDTDCAGVGVCDGTLQVCETYAGNFLPTQTGEPGDQDGICMGGTDDGNPCRIDSQCVNGMCLVDPAGADFFNEVRVRADTTDNPLLGTAEVELPTATCALCP